MDGNDRLHIVLQRPKYIYLTAQSINFLRHNEIGAGQMTNVGAWRFI
jgi:hypothetical protein